MKSGHDAEEDEESRHNAGEDREIWARCRRTRNKTKGSNLGTMPMNLIHARVGLLEPVDHYPIHRPARLPFKWKENVG